jgi:ParB family chromosome partitioning protein
MIKNMKEQKQPSINKKLTSPKYDFSELKDTFEYLGFKSKSTDNKITIQFDKESQIKNFLAYFQE